MRYVTQKYEKQLADLAEKLVTARRYSGQLSLIENVEPLEPSAEPWPRNLRLAEPPEAGWELMPPEAA